MPIFAQAGITGRALSTGFGRLRVRSDDDDGGLRARAARRNADTGGVREDEETRGAEGRTDLRALLQRSQLGELIRERLREASTAATSDADTETTAPGQAAPERPLPGVGTVRTEADEKAERPGRLTPAEANPILNRAQNPVGRVNVPQANRVGAAVRTNIPAFPEAVRPETPPLDRGRDAQIRLLAANAREQAVAAERLTTETPAAPTGAVEPTAEQISRANTTEEIRDNLQAGARVVGTELQSAAARQQQATTQRIAQATEQVAEKQQGETVKDNRSELRELRTEQRQLERDLSETEREIRSRQGQNARLQSGVHGSPAAAAVALGSQLNILSV